MSIGIARVLPDGAALFCDTCGLSIGPAPDPTLKKRIEFITPSIALCRLGITYPEILSVDTLPARLEKLTVEELVGELDSALGKAWYDFVANTLTKYSEDELEAQVIDGPFNSAVLMLAGIADRPFVAMVSRGLALAQTGKVRVLGVDWPKNQVHIQEITPLLKTETGREIVIASNPGPEAAKTILRHETKGAVWSDEGPVNPFLKRWIRACENTTRTLLSLNPEKFGTDTHWAVIQKAFPAQQGGQKWQVSH